MPNILLSGPPGAGKSQLARDLVAESSAPTAIVDFQGIYSGLLLLRRQADGRYPERDPADTHLLALAEYGRKALISGARAMDVEIIATSSDGSPARREYLRGLLGPGQLSALSILGSKSCNGGCQSTEHSRPNAGKQSTDGMGDYEHG